MDHFEEMRSRAYVSPVMMYLPVSPVAPPKITTFDLETTRKFTELAFGVTRSFVAYLV